MAFTLNVLHQFHIHHLEAKESAYDFIGSLRRLTDNVFASETSDPYPQFLSVMRFWRVLIAQKRLGQAHGIDECLPHQPKGNLIVFCPSCPEPGLNMEENWQEMPDELKHLHQTQLTANGNFHANRYTKNSGPDDYSLFDGLAYYPSEAEFQAYLKTIPKKDPNEKIECFTVKAASKKDEENSILSQTGVINIQCPHGCVKSFANTDYALATALHQTKKLHNAQDAENVLKGCNFLFSYDISCTYLVNIVDRFEKNFPDLVPAVKQFHFLIPLVHVHNHKENCTYKYAASYIYNTGHFHGETAEHEWVELNQLAAQIRQMNNGHCQDAIIDHHSDWNFKKLANVYLYAQKRNHFVGLTLLHADRVPLWNKEDRTKRTLNKNKEVECVYQHNQTKVPSHVKIYDVLINIEKSKDSNGTANSPGCRLVRCINEGLEIERLQRTLHAKVQISLKTPTDLILKEIDLQRRKLRPQINKWKVFYQETTCISYDTLYEDLRSQSTTSATIPNIRDPTLTSTTLAQSAKPAAEDRPECETLCLPSVLTEEQRTTHKLQEFASCEMKLRKGRAFDAIRTTQMIVKLIVSLQDDRVQNARGHTSVTRAIGKIDDAILQRNLQIEEYNACCSRMILLGSRSYESLFPLLTEKDTIWKSTHKCRGIGDSRQMEGQIWNTGITGGAQVKQLTSLHSAVGTMSPMAATAADVSTKGTKAKARSDVKAIKDKKGTKRRIGITEVTTSASDVRDSSNANEKHTHIGWIWQLGSIGKLSMEDLQEWSEEADRVQFFRAEAEMQRWLEEHEIKQAQFMRCIRSFAGLSRTWGELAVKNTGSPGRVAYAKKTAARFARLEHRAWQQFVKAGYQDCLSAMDKGISLASLVQCDRSSRPSCKRTSALACTKPAALPCAPPLQQGMWASLFAFPLTPFPSSTPSHDPSPSKPSPSPILDDLDAPQLAHPRHVPLPFNKGFGSASTQFDTPQRIYHPSKPPPLHK
ncbi:unnamed protein product [Cyclocybe aegerita]|uniref:CxC2-like cysteine cluster KDZ transposase-associated domain-containing protein n=1 Tax=Cyclocybe aegerita TaxID=1973307 RepID=A0A8S0WJJ9_CYCAE|nr:unnamed protein product [Cyclocybe aegerita]